MTSACYSKDVIIKKFNFTSEDVSNKQWNDISKIECNPKRKKSAARFLTYFNSRLNGTKSTVKKTNKTKVTSVKNGTEQKTKISRPKLQTKKVAKAQTSFTFSSSGDKNKRKIVIKNSSDEPDEDVKPLAGSEGRDKIVTSTEITTVNNST